MANHLEKGSEDGVRCKDTVSQVNAGDTAAEAAPDDRSTGRPALRMSLTQRAHQGRSPHTGELDWPVLASAGHLVGRAWHCVLSPALDPGSSDTARSLAMCPALSSPPAAAHQGSCRVAVTGACYPAFVLHDGLEPPWPVASIRV